ncbi:cytochrome P450 [Multifurca ochricompacta]|uniref:Cytochrome P450 n=1 Tax=Multifurca ochricompacta TaxID=376703 RepID=A0AAD4M123_9AGAM|nr:cytochrome P450 [Multifurca ochricompacta]
MNFLRQTTVGGILEDKNKTLMTGAILALIIYAFVSYVRSPWRKLPPSPWRLPILGNTHQLLNKNWLFSKDCKERFKDVMHLDAAGTPMIIFNSYNMAYDVLERHGSNYLDRPKLIMAQTFLNKGVVMSLLNYNSQCRRMRRASQAAFSKTAVRDYHSVQMKEATLLTSAFLTDTSRQDWQKEVQRAESSLILSILYDYPTLTSLDDTAMEGIETYNHRVSHSVYPGNFLVEFFPWMMYIPERFAKWKREGLKHGEEHYELFRGLVNRVRVDLANGGTTPSFSAFLLQNNDRNNLTEPEMSFLTGVMFSGGAESTVTTLIWWTLAMIAYPEVQRRAQAELDAVVGRSRLPTFADLPHLPYVRAMVKEILRWRPTVALGVPHVASEDSWHEGMFIPKGTMCMANMWHCNHDREVFGDDADDFRPERFLDEENGEVALGSTEEGHISYGFARRICPGRHLANDALFIDMARILFAVKFERVPDENGNEVPLDTESIVDLGIVIRPKPYDCKFSPRFPEVLSILAEERERCGV